MKTFLVLSFGALLGVAQASLINGSFETGQWSPGSDDSMQLGGGSTNMTGWTVGGDEIAWIGPANPYAIFASHGSRFLDLAGYANNGVPGTVQQSFATLIGGMYEVSFDQGASTLYGSSKLLATAASASQSFLLTPTLTNQWATRTFQFMATATTTTLTIGEDPSTAGNTVYNGLDNVSVRVVPEPTSMAGALFGLALLLRSKRGVSKF